LKKEYVVLEIAMDHDGAPSVTLSMLQESVLKANADERSPRSGRDLSYLINSDASKISLSYNEYVASGIKVGDRVSVEVTKIKEKAKESIAKLLESTRGPQTY
jgi:hypothetical protein